VDNWKLDLLETLPIVEDAEHAISHVRSQIKLKPDVLLDHLLIAIALKEEPIKVTLVSNAHLDKLETQETITKTLASTQLNALANTLSNSQLILEIAVDAKTATGQHKFQIKVELNVSPDHLLFAMTAPQDNLLTDTLAKNAQLDKFKDHLTLDSTTKLITSIKPT
jgi:hypothetical protein